jgi:hypothetical protein
MQITSFKSTLVSALCAVPLAAMLTACGGGGGGGGVAVNSSPTGTVTISGTAAQGQTLTVVSTLADADGLGTITYQWKADGVVIAGATGSGFVLGQAQVGKAITVVASFTDGKGTAESVTANLTGSIANTNDAPTGTVTISGTAQEGQTLTVTNTLADADGLGTITYQWRADGVAIGGATGNSYTLTLADVGKVISVVASFTDGAGTGESVTQAMSGAAVFSASNLQGIWGTGVVGGFPASAVVLSNGSAWVVVNPITTPIQMYAVALQGTASAYAGSGKQYISGSQAVPTVVAFAVNAAAAVKTTLTGTITPSGLDPQAFNFLYDARYDTPASLADMNGTWTGNRSNNSVAVTWSVNASGVLSGSSTSGCGYAGTVAVHSVPVPVGVFDLTLSETCTNLGVSATKDFAGIVTLSADKTKANFAFTTSSGSEGDIQSMSKP